jgi:3-oxoacyl-[acyl-carrier protein] reductase
MTNMVDLTNRVAIVTGSGRGIGEAIARILAQAGASVAICDVREDLAQKTAASIDPSGAKTVAVAVDVSSEESTRAMVKTVVEHFGRLDILVNNAGVISTVMFEETTLAEWNRVQNVNYNGVFLCTQAAFPALRDSGGGSIINLSSMSARTGGQASAISYAASKTGILGITKASARSLGKYGIRVNAICPGIIETEMIAHWTPEMRTRWEAEMPLRRLGTIDDVAKVVLFLASDLSGYVTGGTIDINGGWVMY